MKQVFVNSELQCICLVPALRACHPVRCKIRVLMTKAEHNKLKRIKDKDTRK